MSMIVETLYGAQEASVLAAGYVTPKVDWNVDPEFQENARKVAFFLVVVWIGFFIGKMLLPGRRGQGVGRGVGGGLAGAAVGILLLLDLNLVPKLVNFAMDIIWWTASLVGLV